MSRTKRSLLLFFIAGFVSLLSAHFAVAVEVGEKAPDFELSSTMGGKLRLSSLQAKKNVLIQFYVLDFTPG